MKVKCMLCRRQVLDLLTSVSSGSGLSAPDAEAVGLLWEECGIPEGHDLTRPAWERFMLQVCSSTIRGTGRCLHYVSVLVHPALVGCFL